MSDKLVKVKRSQVTKEGLIFKNKEEHYMMI